MIKRGYGVSYFSLKILSTWWLCYQLGCVLILFTTRVYVLIGSCFCVSLCIVCWISDAHCTVSSVIHPIVMVVHAYFATGDMVCAALLPIEKTFDPFLISDSAASFPSVLVAVLVIALAPTLPAALMAVHHAHRVKTSKTAVPIPTHHLIHLSDVESSLPFRGFFPVKAAV